MTPHNPEEQIQALQAELAYLRQRQSEMEARLAALEWGRFNAVPHPMPGTPAYTAPVPPVLPPHLLPALEATPPPLPSPMPQPALETQVGLNWINRIAVITLMLGAAFLFKYGVDNEWIGPGLRILFGMLAGWIALGAGEVMSRRGHGTFAQGLTGLGLGLLYLAFWAASSLYELISPFASFLLMGTTTALGGYLSLRYNSQAIALFGLMGGYITPVALSTGDDRPWTLFSYLFALNFGFLIPARMRAWKVVAPLALVATITLYSAWGMENFSAANRPVATVFALLFYVQFATTGLGFAWWAVQFLAPLAMALIWDRQARFLPYELLLAACGLAVSEWKKWSLSPSWTLLSFWIPYWIWINASGTDGLRGWTFAWLCGAFVLFFLWLPWWTVWHTRKPRIGDLTVAGGNAILYFMASYLLLDPVRHSYMGLLALAVAAVHLGLAKALWTAEGSEGERENLPMLAMAAVALTFATLAVPVQFTGFRISMAWAIEGTVLAWLAGRFQNRWFSVGAGFVLLLMFMRVIEADATMYSSISNYALIANPRFLAFVVGAVSLWLGAKFTFESWPKEPIGPGLTYTAGHALMLAGLALELQAWVERSFDVDSITAAFTVSLSILMAAYAVLLVIAGVATRTFLNRALGLALIGVVVVKLYMLDVWQLGRVYRITAFLGLGGLLLAVSFLYSRYRQTLERLLRRDEPEPPPLH